jgi:hypothetical protein
MPTTTASCPRTTLPTVYARARRKDRCWMSAKASKLNAEKEVCLTNPLGLTYIPPRDRPLLAAGIPREPRAHAERCDG